ncbi:spore cortex-lytic enzyme [Clostridium pasteurianum DSM 525 = ATCC 6013]|uniref:Cell wall hydrolase SleB n=1 Tax=Clostridium pasteurianum DSM 525 = ATCC 6013 TaxID=1262449 RepID=A0A0H3J6Y3_CLOPA|nr:cell wall hydrolase [Clostridium pasteurianum]AJA49671.1 spore cortex-lytic enzyme [Clostridium pasteurianum DSM 525 = ATCC 6013]AJA53659.1 spore cortex-lytic enzyme [Clostridium pasteurianum DSM 525 = ATCC 6013]AOZ76822.1 hydrolase [Clostridium pasteurianum DSM 525 = ATCC 6013]AOZ80619.1 hydrolase [Clostridium pasteurianum]ELP58814.1 Spore-cortex-lytic enzyme, SLEB [Clostridium pasteurianum DSM 525 = ATCC 6013]
MKKSIWAIVFILFLGLLPSSIVNAKTTTPSGNTSSSANRGAINLYNEKSDSIKVFSPEGRSFAVTKEDIDLMAKVVYAESNAEPYEGKVAVASVILNRLRDKSFPKSINDVVKQKYAFSCVVDGNINVTANKDCYNAVFDALDGKDPTTNALYFYNPKTARSSWMINIKKTNVKPIGNHTFFVVN